MTSREIWTIGHGTCPESAFLQPLHENDISLLTDVRAQPGSRRSPQFGRDAMPGWLARAGIDYVHRPELGGRRRKQPVDSAINAGWRQPSFKNYADYTLGPEYRKGIEALAGPASTRRVAIMCGEPMPWRCHRLNPRDLLVFALMGAVWFVVSYGLLVLAGVSAAPGRLGEVVASARPNMVGTASSVLMVAPLLTTIAGWWTLLIAAPMVLWSQLTREQVRYERQLSRDPRSGLLNLQGLAAGVRALNLVDSVTPTGPRPFGIVLISVESVLAINRFLGRNSTGPRPRSRSSRRRSRLMASRSRSIRSAGWRSRPSTAGTWARCS